MTFLLKQEIQGKNRLNWFNLLQELQEAFVVEKKKDTQVDPGVQTNEDN